MTINLKNGISKTNGDINIIFFSFFKRESVNKVEEGKVNFVFVYYLIIFEWDIYCVFICILYAIK